MLKAMMRKQLQQTLFTYTKKDHKKKSVIGMVGYAILMLYVVGVIGYMMYSMADVLCAPLVEMNLNWLFFAVEGLMAILLGIYGSVFMTQSILYEAKDNEALLSLPIPPWMILFTRVLSLIIQTFFFIALVMIPAMIVYWKTVKPLSAVHIILWIFLMIFLTLFVQILSCILGWVVALIASHIENKSLITVVLSVVFLGIYFYVYSQINQILGKFLENSRAIGDNMRKMVYPIYQMGLGVTGDIKAFLIFALIIFAVFAVMYMILSKSFIGIVTRRKGRVRKEYKMKSLKVGSLEKALFQKERIRFFGCPVYLLNCGLGVLFFMAGIIGLIWKREMINQLIPQIYPGMQEMYPLFLAAVACMLVSMDAVSAPSISLEGKNLWILQSLPIPTIKILEGKWKLHLMVNMLPAGVFIVVGSIVLKVNPISGVLAFLLVEIFTLFEGLLGLRENLKHPSFSWSSETYAVKQSMSVMLSLFGSWALIMIVGILYFFLYEKISVKLFLLLCNLVFGGLTLFLRRWICTKGCRLFEKMASGATVK